MSKKQIIKLILLNLIIAFVNVILFSRGFIGLTLEGDALLVAFAVTEIVMSVIAFGYGNYKILFSEPHEEIKLLKGGELNETKNYLEALIDCHGKKVLDKYLDEAMDQLSRLQEKDKALDTILLQYFQPTEMTYIKFQGVIDSVQQLFYNNIKKMINRVIIFDDKDYQRTIEKINKLRYDPHSPSSQAGRQMQIYEEQIDNIKGIVDDNELILVKMDTLLNEIIKLDDMSGQELENTDVMREINSLIEQTKFYKQS